MALTNEEIIHSYQMLNGITEDIHTYNHWKSLGFQVRKGQKAIAKIRIWKPGYRKATDTENDEKLFMFMKTAAFFGRSQVDPIEE